MNTDTASFVPVLLALCAAHDPMGLIADGAPADEYLPEVEDIQRHLPLLYDEVGLLCLLHGTFHAMFWPVDVGSLERYRPLAQQIWDAWQAHRPDCDTP